MSSALKAVRGMNDVLPDEAPLWERFEDAARDVFAQYGYRNLRVPIVEQTALFVRGIGDATDIVEKEMYTFEDKLNGESLTLRPEATAGIVRAAIEHSLTYERPQRVWTGGPMFRHERPQKGRYRQFHQLDVEALGFAGPDVDAEQIVMLARLWRALGLADGIGLSINSIGDAEERRAHRADLVDYFERHIGVLDDDAKRRSSSSGSTAPRARTSRDCSAFSKTAASHTRSTPGSYVASITTIVRCSSGSPTASARRAPLRVADATTACSSSWAASRRQRADSRSGPNG